MNEIIIMLDWILNAFLHASDYSFNRTIEILYKKFAIKISSQTLYYIYFVFSIRYKEHSAFDGSYFRINYNSEKRHSSNKKQFQPNFNIYSFSIEFNKTRSTRN